MLHEPAISSILKVHRGSGILQHLLGSHTLSDEVGGVAAAAGAGTLVLNHLVPPDGSVPDEVWIAEARKGYDGLVVVGEDLMEI